MHSSLKPEQAGQGSKDKGTLRSMTELFLAVCEVCLGRAEREESWLICGFRTSCPKPGRS